MKKHIIGLTLFSLIVSAAAVIYVAVKHTEIPNVAVPADNSENLFERWNVKPGQRYNSMSPIIIRQAVFDLKTGMLKYQFDAPDNAQVVLHFYVKESGGTRYLNSFFVARPFEQPNIKTGGYLQNLEPTGNLYIIAELTEPLDFQAGQTHPKFDANLAAPVLVAGGK